MLLINSIGMIIASEGGGGGGGAHFPLYLYIAPAWKFGVLAAVLDCNWQLIVYVPCIKRIVSRQGNRRTLIPHFRTVHVPPRA